MECSELTHNVTLTVGVAPEIAASLEAKLHERSSNSVRDAVIERSEQGEQANLLRQACLEAFGDRIVMGTCTYPDRAIGNDDHRDLPEDVRAVLPDGAVAPRIASVTVARVARFYDFGDVFENDYRMRECINGNGAWSALRRDSDDFESVQVDFHLREAQEAARRIRSRAR